MKVAVLMSTYNGENYIREQIDSILAQEGDFDLELWVRDDGSNDSTIEILKEYALTRRLHWYTGDNLKPARSFIDLVKHCSDYDYYSFADQDDFWLPGKISSGIVSLKDKDSIPVLYCSNAELVDSKLQSLGRTVYEYAPKTDLCTLSCAGGLLGCTMIFNSELAKTIQLQDIPDNIVMHDFMLAELCLAMGGEIIYDSKPTMKYRQHGKNVIGVSYGFVKTFMERIKDIRTPMVPGIAEQAESMMYVYRGLMTDESYCWLNDIAGYKRNYWKRIKLAMSNRTRFANRNLGLKVRLAILLGNR